MELDSRRSEPIVTHTASARSLACCPSHLEMCSKLGGIAKRCNRNACRVNSSRRLISCCHTSALCVTNLAHSEDDTDPTD
eukprot:1922039-Amphidinium_carterae.1